MRFAAASVLSAVVLAVAGVVGSIGAWSIPVAAVFVLGGAVAAAISLEGRDLESVRGLAGGDDDEGVAAPVAAPLRQVA